MNDLHTSLERSESIMNSCQKGIEYSIRMINKSLMALSETRNISLESNPEELSYEPAVSIEK